MNFIVKKTQDLSKEEVLRILDIFKAVFDVTRSETVFYNQFLNTQLGYSYHLLMLDDNGEIVGSHTYVPAFFSVNNIRHLFVTGADVMVLKGYRDIFTYLEMLKYGRKYLKENGVDVEYGYPNDLNFEILSKAKLTKHIGEMYTYCLPYRIGGIKDCLGALNWCSMAACLIWLNICSFFASNKVYKFLCEKDLVSYNKVRYKRNDGNYGFGDGFTYKIMNYEGIRAAFLIDVFEKSPRNFCKAVKHIIQKESKNIDIVIYPGLLPFKLCGLLKIPHKFEPKHFHLVATILNKKEISEDIIYNINNWDTNLSNYDLV